MNAGDSSVVTFDEAPPPGCINFGVGQPSADLLPIDLVRRASERFFASGQPLELNYGEKQGDIRYRRALAALLEREYGTAARPDCLFLTAGNSQALDFVCSRLTRPGDMVFVEEPSYFLAFRIFRDHGLEIVGIPMDPEGMDLDCLERELARRRPKLVYTIPSYHNPTGRTLGLERRRRLVALSRSHGFVIAADEVYQMLYYGEAPPAALGTMTDEGNVLSLGSFSKILAPGMRLGWIQTDVRHLQALMLSGVINSGGSFNHFASHVVRHALEAGLLDEFVLELRAEYGARVQAMDGALRRHLGELASWEVPQGGYFFWLELREAIDTAAFRDAATAAMTGFQPGNVFSARGAGLGRFLRLSFAHYDEREIEEGIARLAAVLRSGLRNCRG